MFLTPGNNYYFIVKIFFCIEINYFVFSEIARARSGAMQKLIGTRGLREPHHT